MNDEMSEAEFSILNQGLDYFLTPIHNHKRRHRMAHHRTFSEPRRTGFQIGEAEGGSFHHLGDAMNFITPSRLPQNPGEYNYHDLQDPEPSSYLNNSWPDFTTEGSMPPAPTFNEMSMIKTVVLSLMFVISLIGNTATLIQMYRMRRRRSTINTLILHLATADLIVTFFCNITDAVWASTVQWYGGNAMCKMVKFLQVFGLYLSTYIIVIISVDRAYAILDPMSRNNAAKRVRTMIALAWLLSALFALPQSYIFRVERGPFIEEFYQCVTYGAYSALWQEKLYSSLSVLFMFVIPLVSMVTAYMLIFCTIAKKSRDLQRETETTTDMLSFGPYRGQLFRKAKVKSLRMTALIVAAFIICWTPYYVVFIVFTFYDRKDIDVRSSMWIFFFGMANSMVNPLIYGAFHVCKRRKREVSCPVNYARGGTGGGTGGTAGTKRTGTSKTSSSSGRSPRAQPITNQVHGVVKAATKPNDWHRDVCNESPYNGGKRALLVSV